jgi:hypothetical protein
MSVGKMVETMEPVHTVGEIAKMVPPLWERVVVVPKTCHIELPYDPEFNTTSNYVSERTEIRILRDSCTPMLIAK